MGPRPDALRAAIDQAWQAFDLPAPTTTGVCEFCCMDPRIEADFLLRPARDLPLGHVRDWYFAAYTEAIRHAHVAWFLPRVLELLADGEDVASVGNQVAFSRLPLTGFPERWPERQVAALDRFALAYLQTRLAAQPAMDWADLDSLLCMFGEGGIDIGPLLRCLDRLSDDALAALLCGSWRHAAQGWIPVDAFWSREPARSQAWGWYTSAALLQRMERAALAGNPQALEVHAVIEAARAKAGL